MSAESIVKITVGEMGCGKTYTRCAVFLVEDWLPHCKGVHYSNFPVRVDNLVEVMKQGGFWRRGMDEEEVKRRVVRIPQDVIKSWMEPEGLDGPWNYFRGWDLSGAHIALDEAQVFVPKSGSSGRRKLFREWMGEIRHFGATVELITPNECLIDKDVLEMGRRIRIANLEGTIDGIVGARLYDWYQLKAKFLTGYWSPRICQQEYLQREDKKWYVNGKMKSFCLKPLYYRVYDSYSAPVSEGGHVQEGVRPEHPYERLCWWRVILWFIGRNWWGLGKVSAVVVLLVWGFFLGGFIDVARGAFHKVTHFAVRHVDDTSRGGAESGPAAVERSVVADPNGYRLVMDGGVVAAVVGGRDVTLDDLLGGYMGRRSLEAELVRARRVVESMRGSKPGVVALSGECVWLSTGEILYVGESSTHKGMSGLVVQSIDLRRRCIVWSDGVVVFMGMYREGGGRAIGAGMVEALRVPAAGTFRGSSAGGGRK